MMDTMSENFLADMICHVAFAFTLVGTRLISAKRDSGWWLRALGDAMLLVGGVLSGMTSFIFWTGILLYMDTSAAIRSRFSKETD